MAYSFVGRTGFLKKVKKVIVGLAIVAVLATSAFLYAINTEAMLQWGFVQLSSSLTASHSKPQFTTEGEILRVGRIRGRLFGPISLEDLQFETSDIKIHAADVSIVWQPATLLYGNFNILSLVINDIDIRLTEPSTKKSTIRDDVDRYIKDLDKLLVSFPIDIDSAQLRNIRIVQAPLAESTLIDVIKFNVRVRSDKLYVDGLEIVSPNYSASATGEISENTEMKLDVSAKWQSDTEPNTVQATLKIQGDRSKVKLNAILHQPGELEFNGTLEDPFGKVYWNGKLAIRDFDYRPYLPHEIDVDTLFLNGTAKVHGDLESANIKGRFKTSLPDIGDIDAQLDLAITENNLGIKQASITQPGATANVQIQGDLSIANATWMFKGQSQWRDLQWPLTGPAELILKTGEIQGKISKTAYSLSLNRTTLQFQDHSLSGLSAIVEGNEQALTISEFNATQNEATISGNANVDWQDSLSWDASLQANNINPGHYNAQWPGSITVVLRNSGKYHDGTFDTIFQIDNSSGTLRERPFTGSGNIKISKQDYSSDGLSLVWGNSKLNARGSIGTHWDLSWKLGHVDIGLLFPDAKGKLSGEGKISGDYEQPLVVGKILASDIDIDGQQKIDLVSADINVDLSGKKRSRLVLEAQNIMYSQYQVDKLEIKTSGTQANHQINVIAKVAKDTIRLGLHGKLENDNDLFWVGKLTKGNLITELAGEWGLESDAALIISKNLFQFEKSCWSANPARWCTETHWQKGQNLDAYAKFTDIPMSLFQPFLQEQLQIKGLLNGTAELHAANQRIHNAKVALKLDNVDLQVSIDGQLKQVTSVQSGTLIYEQTTNKIGGELALQFSEKDTLTAAIDLTSPTNASVGFNEWPVEAYVKANSQHPGLIRLFYTAIGEINGTWQSDIKMRGTLNKPLITGYSNIMASEVRLPDAGLVLQKVKLGISSEADNRFKITGGFSSGNGSIVIDGSLITDPSQAWPMALTVRGDRVQVLNVGKTIVEVSPDLQIKKLAERIDVNGSVEISRAKIIAAAGLSESVKMSNDVIFVDEQVSAQEINRRVKSPLKVYSDVEILLSDNVYFEGYGLSGRLVGGVKVQSEPGKAATGQGAFHIRDGRYKAYGITLDLDIGRLIYANDPVDKPAINARASNRTGDITAGFRITGYLTEPEIKVYSIPSMPDNEALSYLLFGKKVDDTSFGRDSFDSLGGSNSNTDGLKLGDALDPSGYIDYVVGLMNSSTVLRIRFELN
ncbi:MAG: translocation/assembly module TamB domain-containing protein, partial [Thiohalomonadales bacterium]